MLHNYFSFFDIALVTRLHKRASSISHFEIPPKFLSSRLLPPHFAKLDCKPDDRGIRSEESFLSIAEKFERLRKQGEDDYNLAKRQLEQMDGILTHGDRVEPAHSRRDGPLPH